MTIDEHAEMPTCNLVETMHNKWLQQSGNKMVYLYEVTGMTYFVLSFIFQIAGLGWKKDLPVKVIIQCPQK